MMSLIQALGLTSVASPSGKALMPKQQHHQHAFSEPDEQSRAWAMLACDGFTHEVLSLLDPNVVALSFQVFHHRLLQNLLENISLAHILDCDAFPANTQSSDPDTIAGHASPLS